MAAINLADFRNPHEQTFPHLELACNSDPLPESVLRHMRENSPPGPDRLVDKRNAVLWIEGTTDVFRRRCHLLKGGLYMQKNMRLKIASGGVERAVEEEQ